MSSFNDGGHNAERMTCPLCGVRKARRSCPALGHLICTMCCGTKRLTEIRCPADCPYLTSAREHPAAAVRRRQETDLAQLVHGLRDLNEQQSRLFVAVTGFISQYQAPDIHPLIDDDVAEAAGALASTFETASRGLIYDHRPSARQAERLMAGLRTVLDESERRAGSGFARDAAVVLRRVEEMVRDARSADARSTRTYLELVGRVMTKARRPESAEAPGAAEDGPRLIVP